ncbi:MAG: hypothetical protein JXR86_17045 [Spirochaetales bacterium]|nr:hypothetical protein [Spirochaetales bacterium]
MKKKLLFLSVLILSLFSCNDVSDFLFETEQSVEIRTVDSGAIFYGGESIPLDILSVKAAVPEKYTVTIIDELGVNWGETTVLIENPEEEYASSLVVPPELPSGKYIFHISVFENDVLIADEDLTIFKAESAYLINELISLPQETVTGKDVFIQASITAPSERDPFLRWRLEGSILSEGYLSEGSDTLYWKAGDKTGLYSIELEVFPEQVSAELVSSIRDSVVIVVSDKELLETGSLQPEEDYSFLYHFAGDLIPVNPEKFVHSLIGVVGAKAYNNYFLYTLSGNNGIAATGPILPSQERLLTPFSINGRFSLSLPPSTGNILLIEDEEGFLCSLSALEGGYLKLDLDGLESVSEVPFDYEVLTELTVHVLPGIETTEIRWFINGLAAGKTVLDRGDFTVSEQQSSLVGGNSEIRGVGLILDELGVYRGSDILSSVESNQYLRVLQEQLGSDLVSANGFDGPDSGLTVKPGQRVRLADFAGSVKDLVFYLNYEPVTIESDRDLVLAGSGGEEIIRLSNDILGYEDPLSLKFTQKFHITRDKNGSALLECFDGDGKSVYKAEISLKTGQPYSLFLEIPVENKSEVTLDYFYIKTVTDSHLPQAVAAAGDEENLL